MKNLIKRKWKCEMGKKGFTLVEILVSVAIFAILIAAVSTVFLVGESSWQTNSVRMELQQELRKAMDWMKNDLRQTRDSAITGGPVVADGQPYTSITFYLPNGVSGGSITWNTDTTQFILGGTDNNQLQRIEGADTRVLALNIETLEFTRQAATSGIIEVLLAAEKDTIKGATITSSLTFEIQMRN